MSFQWPKEGASVVLLPQGAMGAAILELAKEWTEHRLLAPALYVKVEEQSERAYLPFEQTGPLKLSALVVGRNGSVDVDLFDELGRNELDLLRVVACRMIEASEAFHEKQDQMVDRIREQVELSAPLREVDGSKVFGTRILRINLISGATSNVKGSVKNLIEVEWDSNILLSPEDRSTPSGFDTFIDSSDPEYPGFLLSNIASTAGLWTGVNKSILELQEFESGHAFDKVMVLRTFGRVVKTDTLAVKLSSSALKQIEVEGSPLKDPTYNLKDKSKITEQETPGLIQALVTDSMQIDNAALSFSFNLEREKRDANTKVSFREGLKLFFGFFWQKLIALPMHLIDAVVSTFNRKATNLLFGEDTGYEVEARKDFKKFGLQAKEAEDLIKISEVKKTVATTLDGIPLAPDYRSQHPSLWEGIRKQLIGSLEGNNKGQAEAFNGKVLVDAEKLIPKYGYTWTVPACAIDPEEDPEEIKSSLDWLDVDLAEKIRAGLDADITYLQGELEGYRQELVTEEAEMAASKINVKDIRRTKEKLTARKATLASIVEGVGDER